VGDSTIGSPEKSDVSTRRRLGSGSPRERLLSGSEGIAGHTINLAGTWLGRTLAAVTFGCGFKSHSAAALAMACLSLLVGLLATETQFGWNPADDKLPFLIEVKANHDWAKRGNSRNP
jgi:hypothetical protein